MFPGFLLERLEKQVCGIGSAGRRVNVDIHDIQHAFGDPISGLRIDRPNEPHDGLSVKRDTGMPALDLPPKPLSPTGTSALRIGIGNGVFLLGHEPFPKLDNSRDIFFDGRSDKDVGHIPKT